MHFGKQIHQTTFPLISQTPDGLPLKCRNILTIECLGDGSHGDDGNGDQNCGDDSGVFPMAQHARKHVDTRCFRTRRSAWTCVIRVSPATASKRWPAILWYSRFSSSERTGRHALPKARETRMHLHTSCCVNALLIYTHALILYTKVTKYLRHASFTMKICRKYTTDWQNLIPAKILKHRSFQTKAPLQTGTF